jgi:hypothetical protein
MPILASTVQQSSCAFHDFTHISYYCHELPGITSYVVIFKKKMLQLDLTIGLDTDDELREGALQVLQHIRPEWTASNIRN